MSQTIVNFWFQFPPIHLTSTWKSLSTWSICIWYFWTCLKAISWRQLQATSSFPSPFSTSFLLGGWYLRRLEGWRMAKASSSSYRLISIRRVHVFHTFSTSRHFNKMWLIYRPFLLLLRKWCKSDKRNYPSCKDWTLLGANPCMLST